MLDKKTWNEILEGAYNKYNYPDNDEDLPDWFVKDE